MPSTDSTVETYLFRAPTPEEVDALATISAISFVLALVAFLCVVVAASMVAVKTKLPGRYCVLLGVLLLPGWWGIEQYYSGSFEMTFGPAALLVSVVVYSAFAVLFSIGFVRMSFCFVRRPPSRESNG
ncbi:hypothetical protein [Nitrogeniibacter aestuarii]|uniref:hypothetical protein n=1 Tax=Nitrogeniibacter aestuarii TaxID=2815343 RepID=UPI001D0FE6F1|nr:hypothetical protein [Nitrogeniibacter aestuarii]